jgi:hypothetical protein
LVHYSRFNVFFKTAKRPFEDCGETVNKKFAALEYGLLVPGNLLECRWDNFKIVLESLNRIAKLH